MFFVINITVIPLYFFYNQISLFHKFSAKISELGWAMVLGSFQCRGVLLLLHIVGQEPAVLAAGAGWVDYIFLYFSSVFPF